jgi:hypothetical protein
MQFKTNIFSFKALEKVNFSRFFGKKPRFFWDQQNTAKIVTLSTKFWL